MNKNRFMETMKREINSPEELKNKLRMPARKENKKMKRG